jgi:hypothetical protein
VVSDLFKFGGGRALVLSNPMQRHLRNALAARQHVALSEENYEAAGRYLLESAKAAARDRALAGGYVSRHSEAARRAETEAARVSRVASVISMSMQASVTDWP